MTPVMFEQDLHRAAEVGFFDVEISEWKAYEKDGEYETRKIKRIRKSDHVGTAFTTLKDFVIVLEGCHLMPIYKGDVIEINKTENNNPTGIQIIFNHAPTGSKYKRLATDFRSVRRMWFDA